MGGIEMKQSDIDSAEIRSKKYRLALPKPSGFYCEITPTGTKRFILRYRPQGLRNKKDFKIGPANREKGGLTLRDATRLAEKEYARIIHGEDITEVKKEIGPELTIEELLKKVIKHKLDKGDCGKKQALNYDGYARNWINPKFGKLLISKLTKEQFQEWLDKHPKPKTGGHVAQFLKAAYNLAIDWTLVDNNPILRTQFVTGDKRTRYLDRDELVAFSEALKKYEKEDNPLRWRFSQCVRLLLLTGARLSNIMEARWEWIHWNMGFMAIPATEHKTGRITGEPYYINLGESAFKILRELKEECDSEWVIAGKDPSKPLNGYRKIWLDLIKDCGFKNFTLHDLRHSYASYVANGGDATLLQLQKLLNHRSAESTQRYAHLFNKKARDLNDALANEVNL